MRSLVLAALSVAVCSVAPAWGQENTPEDEPQEPGELRVDLCSSEEPHKEVETTEEREARSLKTAGESYDLGLVLYEEGDYRGAVDAFVKSYCTKAHPSAFYNIGQSYERLLDFQRASQYFARFVAEADASDPNSKRAALRAEVLRSLPAQLRIATVPSGALVTIRNDAGITASGKANGKAPIEVRQGSYTMHIEKPGFESITQTIEVLPGQPYSHYLRLDPEKAKLQVTVDPRNARIFVDKRLVGAGTYTEALPIGTYEITVEAPKRNSHTRIVQLTAGRPNIQVIGLQQPKASGRTELLVASGIGLGITGAVAVSSIFDQDPVITLAAGLTTTAIGFGGAYFGIPENLGRGDAWYLIESAMIGFTEGGLIGSYFACNERVVTEIVGDQEIAVASKEDCADGVKAGAAITGAMVGALSASASRSSFALSTGDAALVGSGAFWGLLTGSLFYKIFDSEYRLRDPMLFVGMNLGVVAAAGLVANSDVSLQRIAVIDLAGTGGLIGGVGIARALATRDDQTQHYALLGLITGLVGGTFLTRALDDVPATLSAEGLTMVPGVSTAQDLQGKSVMSFGVSASF